MIITRFASETYMTCEFNYKDDTELSKILQELDHFKRRELVKGDITVIPCHVRDIYKGCVFATIRCDALDTLYYRLSSDNNDVTEDVYTTTEDYITISEPMPF